MAGARGATSCMVCCAQDHSVVVLIALKTISSLLEMMIIQMNDEQRFSRQKIVQSLYSTCITLW
jgi:hypothetical protein